MSDQEQTATGCSVHMSDPTRLHGIRCNHPRASERTFDDWRVTCSRCRSLPAPIEEAPANAFRYAGPLYEIDGGGLRPGERLNLRNFIFVDGGSLVWFEEPDVVAVMHARGGHTVARYQGVWEPATDKVGADRG